MQTYVQNKKKLDIALYFHYRRGYHLYNFPKTWNLISYGRDQKFLRKKDILIKNDIIDLLIFFHGPNFSAISITKNICIFDMRENWN